MLGFKSFMGLSLACAVVCAFGAGSALAAETTAGECVKDGGAKDFADAHCNTEKFGGEFGHVLFENGKPIEITAVNDLTGTAPNFVFEGKANAILFRVECTGVAATGTVTNNAVGAVTWGAFTAEFTGCTLQKPEGGGCKGSAVTVAEFEATPTGPHNLGLSGALDLRTGPTNEMIEYHREGAGKGMGLKFVPSGTNFTTLTFAAGCGFGGAPIPVKGSIFATPGRGGNQTSSGATAEFTKSSTIGGLIIGAATATIEGTLTLRKTDGNPLILTTTP
jgi:hypothetical protein